MLGAVGAVLVAAVFAVQMAVNGVALKATIDAWVNATDPAAKEVAFQVAEGVRSIEKGLSGFFHLVNGVTLLTLGLSVATGRAYPRWLGWAGAASGVGFVIGGIVTAHTGFSAIAGTVRSAHWRCSWCSRSGCPSRCGAGALNTSRLKPDRAALTEIPDAGTNTAGDTPSRY